MAKKKSPKKKTAAPKAKTDIVAQALGKAPYPRDLYGYGPNPPDPKWPGGARVAVNFVLNYEEGSERSIQHGDKVSETYLTEIPGGTPRVTQRDRAIRPPRGRCTSRAMKSPAMAGAGSITTACRLQKSAPT